MRAYLWVCAVAGVALAAPAPAADPAGGGPAKADLAKVDRAVGKEPAYKGKPRYCLLVFGPEARTRVWLVVDDEHLYVDRNANGDLTEAGERVAIAGAGPRKQFDGTFFDGERTAKAGEVREGPLVHADLTVTQARFRVAADPKTPAEREEAADAARSPDGCMYVVTLAVELPAGLAAPRPGRVEQFAGADTAGPLFFGPLPKEAPVLHFNGPLAMGVMPRQALRRGGPEAELRAGIVTPGIGSGATVHLSYLTLKGLVPDGVRPVVEADYPGPAPGAPGVKARFELAGRCCGNQFHDRVKVPGGVGVGTAKLTLSLPGWKEGKVAPATVEVPVVDAPSDGKDGGGKP